MTSIKNAEESYKQYQNSYNTKRSSLESAEETSTTSESSHPSYNTFTIAIASDGSLDRGATSITRKFSFCVKVSSIAAVALILIATAFASGKHAIHEYSMATQKDLSKREKIYHGLSTGACAVLSLACVITLLAGLKKL